jgi:phage terminase Nu1 subunit (DNA packaging protein)
MADADDTAGTIALDVAARLIMVEPGKFAALARAGWFKAVTPGRYRLVEVVQGYLKALQHEIERGRTAAEAAAHVDLGTRGFIDLVDRGIIPRAAKGSYGLDECRRLYIRHIRAAASGHGDMAAGASLSSERALLAKEQREGMSLKNAISRGDFVSVVNMVRKLGATFSVIREKLLTLPGKTADSCEMRERSEIEDIMLAEITEILNELHDAASYGSDDADERGRGGDPGVQAAPDADTD